MPIIFSVGFQHRPERHNYTLSPSAPFLSYGKLYSLEMTLVTPQADVGSIHGSVSFANTCDLLISQTLKNLSMTLETVIVMVWARRFRVCKDWIKVSYLGAETFTIHHHIVVTEVFNNLH